MAGVGSMIWKDGDQYSGQWENGYRYTYFVLKYILGSPTLASITPIKHTYKQVIFWQCTQQHCCFPYLTYTLTGFEPGSSLPENFQ
jgi:hypothetical protein